ncbi:hypothetical protein DMENIID0001_042870 [Sergentomyia squamirostris]
MEGLSDDEIQCMELLEGKYEVYMRWPSSPSYFWNNSPRPVIKIAAVRYECIHLNLTFEWGQKSSTISACLASP